MGRTNSRAVSPAFLSHGYSQARGPAFWRQSPKRSEWYQDQYAIHIRLSGIGATAARHPCLFIYKSLLEIRISLRPFFSVRMQNKELPERPAAVCRVNIESLSLPNPTKGQVPAVYCLDVFERATVRSHMFALIVV